MIENLASGLSMGESQHVSAASGVTACRIGLRAAQTMRTIRESTLSAFPLRSASVEPRVKRGRAAAAIRIVCSGLPGSIPEFNSEGDLP